LNELSANAAKLVAANVEVIAIDVDTLSEEYKSAHAAASKYQKKAKMPFAVGLADEPSLTRITGVWQDAMYRKRQPPLPSSFLVDSLGRLRIVYSGPVEVDQLLRDAANLDVADDAWKRSAIPFAGRSSEDEFITNPIAIASIYREEMQYADATEYLLRYIADNPTPPSSDDSSDAIKYRRRVADVYHHLGKIAMDEKRFDEAVKYLDQAVESSGEMASALIDRATCLQQTGDLVGAQRSLDGALRQRPHDADAWNQMGVVCLSLKQIENAANCFERSLKENQRAYSAANNLAWLRATTKSANLRNGQQALSLARGLASGPGADRPDVLDTLAAAYAETADFENAIKTADRAIDLAKRQGLSDLAERIRMRLTLYRQSEPFHE
jgi:tetratricopeptide (TPR) repeat protein